MNIITCEIICVLLFLIYYSIFLCIYVYNLNTKYESLEISINNDTIHNKTFNIHDLLETEFPRMYYLILEQ